ncbi:hypothetical protein ACFRJ8_15770 [Arthrobacter sp. NPDC056886]|uniref:hypothetical protein n=1 Tax=Arthrobacter sp. NPDC056886 TaxID=3345960 RepID=UPI00366EAD2E
MSLRWGENGISTIFLAFLVGQLANVAKDSPGLGTLAIVVSAVVDFATAPLAGLLSDRFGRRRMNERGSLRRLMRLVPGRRGGL